MLHRPQTVARQVVGIIMLIPGLLHVPLPQADFHIIRHHHGVGQICPQHDHLLRWHPQADEAEDVAILHWHWLLPQALDIMQNGAFPTLHAHVVDSLQPEWNGDQVILSSEERARVSGSLDLASWIDLALIDAAAIDLPGLVPRNAWIGAPDDDGHSSGTALARLVRWNC